MDIESMSNDKLVIMRSVQAIDESIAKLQLARSTLLSLLPKKEAPVRVYGSRH